MSIKNVLVGQSGGPTAAINATLAGVISAVVNDSSLGDIYGMINGIKGATNDNIVNLSQIFDDDEKIELLKQTPSAFLGSCRYKLNFENDDVDKIMSVAKKYNIGYIFYIGGNDSMDTVLKLKSICAENGINVIGIPKTIDNDLMATDHCPGFGSAAKYIATTMAEIIRDCKCYSIESVTIVEIMGRNAGWLTASSALARLNGEISPDLIYLPEVDFDFDKFLDDIKEKVIERQNIVIAISEGIKQKNGKYVADQSEIFKEDLFGHSQLGGAGKVLEKLIKQKYGIKVRSIELNTPQRCASHIASKTDIDESFMIAYNAVKFAKNGESGKMMIYKRVSDNPYKVDFGCIDIDKIANYEKKIPQEFITDNKNDVNEKFIEYVYPLIQGETDTKYKNGIPIHLTLENNK